MRAEARKRVLPTCPYRKLDPNQKLMQIAEVGDELDPTASLALSRQRRALSDQSGLKRGRPVGSLGG